MYNCLVLQLKKVFAFFYNSKLCYCFDTTYFFFFLNHFFGRHWDSASSPCLGGVTGESRLWLQPQGTPIWSTRWSCGEPMLLFPSRTSSFTMVCHVLLPWTSGKLFELQIGFHLNMCALCVCVCLCVNGYVVGTLRGAWCLQMECEDEATHGGGVWGASLC